MITFVSLFGLDFGALVAGGALLTEVVFGLPGVGKLTYDSLQNLDLPVIMATVTYASFFIVMAITWLLLRGARESATANNVMVVIKLLALTLFVAVGEN